MRAAFLPLAVLIATIAAAPSAHAQVAVTPFVAVSVASRTGFVDLEDVAGDVKALYGGWIGWRVTRRLSVGFEGSWMPRFLEDTGEFVERGRLMSWMGQVDYVVWPSADADGPQLFVTAAAGAVRIDLDDVLDAFTEVSTLPGGAVGAGLLLPLRDRVRLRSDFRYVRSGFAEGGRAAFDERHVSFWRLATGVMIEF
jgi:hypothetical protein